APTTAATLGRRRIGAATASSAASSTASTATTTTTTATTPAASPAAAARRAAGREDHVRRNRPTVLIARVDGVLAHVVDAVEEALAVAAREVERRPVRRDGVFHRLLEVPGLRGNRGEVVVVGQQLVDLKRDGLRPRV